MSTARPIGEPVRKVDTTRPPYFIDEGGSKSFGALCACDGKPIDPTVAAMVASYGLPP